MQFKRGRWAKDENELIERVLALGVESESDILARLFPEREPSAIAAHANQLRETRNVPPPLPPLTALSKQDVRKLMAILRYASQSMGWSPAKTADFIAAARANRYF